MIEQKTTKDVYWGEFPEKEMDNLLQICESKGMEAARVHIRDVLKREDFVFGASRSHFLNLLDITKESVCLDCGSGLGVHTMNMASVAKEVHAFDLSSKRLRFLGHRADAEGLQNVFLYHSGFAELPFSENSFDVIIMNGVVEWLGEIHAHENPREDQIAVLRQMYRYLKPGGRLYIGIENRWAAAYLRGYDHNGLKWTNFLPRFLANSVTRVFKKKPYRTYTYAASGYRALLRDSFFTKPASFYVAYPGYNSPQYLIAHDDFSALRFFYKSFSVNKGFKGKILTFFSRWNWSLRMIRTIVWSYGIVAEK